MPKKGDFKPLYERYRIDESGCWLWTGAIMPNGYANFHVNRKSRLAHRYFYEFYNSTKIPPGKQIDHLCKRRHCVNPHHLQAVTSRENNRRSDGPSGINARKTECKRGHPLSGDNLYLRPDGNRDCKTCKRQALKVWYDKHVKKPIVVQTECLRGHPLSGDNLYVDARGCRVCKACKRLRKQEYADKQYAAYYTAYLAIVDEGR